MRTRRKRHSASFGRVALGLGLSLMGWLFGTPLSLLAAPSVQVGLTVHILNPPNPVTDLSAAPVGSVGDVQLVWTAPANNNGARIDHYEVRFTTFPAPSTAGAEGWWSALPSTTRALAPAHAPGVVEFGAITGLSPGVTYYFGIKSVDADNQISPIDARTGAVNQAASEPVGGSTSTPNAPLNFAGVALGTSTVRWTWDPSLFAAFYVLDAYPSGAMINQAPVAPIDETGLSPNTAVSRTLRAGNLFGLSGPSIASTVYTLASTPATLLASRIGFTDVDLAWNANGNPAGTQMKVERSLDGVSFVPAGLVSTSAFSDTGLTEATTYYYRVRAINGDGIQSAPSAVLKIATPRKADFMPPEAPMGLKGDLDSTGRAFTLIWEAATLNADGTPISDLAGYNVYRSSALVGVGTKLNPIPLTVTAFADEVDGQTFYYTVRAVDTSGNESADSLYADSSLDADIIFLAPDRLSSVKMPSSVSDLLRSAHNKYGVPLSIKLIEEPAPASSAIVRSVRLVLTRADTNQEITDLAFASPQAVVGVGYANASGEIRRGDPTLPQAEPVADVTASDLSLYWFNGVSWIKVGGTQDQIEHVIRTKSSYLGQYQVRTVPAATSLSLEKANVYPSIITPNGDGLNDRVYFVLENPNNADVDGEIVDLKGRSIATLPKAATGGLGTTLIWDGKDSAGNVVPGGVYIYRIRGEGKTFTGTVGVAR